jgi:cell filamentation protein, protein adenylyltransferase
MRTLWQSFRLDLERAPVRLWAALGRLEAFGETLATLPAAPGMASSLLDSWRTRAAGGTLAAEAAAAGVAEPDPEIAAVLSTLYDEIDRRTGATNGGATNGGAAGGSGAGAGDTDALTPQILCADNAAVTEIAAAAGLLDPEPAGGASAGAAATLSDQLVEGPRAWARLNQFCTWLHGPEFRADPGEAVQTAILQALGAHLFLLRLAPFRHCNDATARLAAYRLLRAAGLPAMTAHLPAAHFAATGDRYADLIGEASNTGGATFAFVAYAAGGIGDGMRQQIAALGAAHQANYWRDRIADLFDGRTRSGDIRRRMLIEALGREGAPVRIGRLRYLTPKLAEAYAGKSEKTLSRDVRWLEEEGLVQRTLLGVKALCDEAGAKQAA